MICKIICWIFGACCHDWSKWQDMGQYAYAHVKLKRTCTKCGLVKTRIA